MEIDYKDDGSIEMTQSHLIPRLLDLCGIDSEKVNGRDTPVGKPLLHKDLKTSCSFQSRRWRVKERTCPEGCEKPLWIKERFVSLV